MTDGSPLRRKIGASRPDASRVTSTDRVWRRAVSHGIGRGLGLEIEVTGVAKSATTPEAATALMTESMLVVLLDGPGSGGIALLDAGPMTAVVEQQTRGSLGKRSIPDRAPTATDAALAADTLDNILTAFDMMTAELGMTGTVTGYRFGTHLSQSREIALALKDAPHELWRIDMTFPQSESRAGALHLVLPHEPVPELLDQTPADLWGEKIESRVMGSEIALDAELGRMTMTAEALRALVVGQTLHLPRSRIGTVELKGPGGTVLGRGRLGQSAGRKALRIETARPEPFHEHREIGVEEAG